MIMKKIMFNDRYGLTQAVLEGRKTMTRRIITDRQMKWLYFIDGEPSQWYRHGVKYLLSEIVAIAQSYQDIYDENVKTHVIPRYSFADDFCDTPGWTNKMFVRSDYMKHFIKITGVRFEHLQDITDEDIMAEGIYTVPVDNVMHIKGYAYTFKGWQFRGTPKGSDTPRGAFAALIDKISGKGTWDSNPWVAVYSFEVIKEMNYAKGNTSH